MDFQYPHWARLWSIRKSISVVFVLRLDRSDVSSMSQLVRYEIVALHSAGQPQYYPGCVYVFLLDSVSVLVTQRDLFHSQVNVMNGGADKPSASDFASFPGMYNGFKWPDIWTDSLDGFVVAGPNVVSFADGSSDGGSSDPSPSSASSPSPSGSSSAPRPQSTTTPANPTSTGVCRTKRRTNKRSVSARHVHRRSTHH